MTTYNLALLYASQAQNASEQNDRATYDTMRSQSLRLMQSTLDVYTADGFPADYQDALAQIVRIEAMTYA